MCINTHIPTSTHEKYELQRRQTEIITKQDTLQLVKKYKKWSNKRNETARHINTTKNDKPNEIQ